MKRKWPWIAEQNWKHALFLHWSFPKEMIEHYIPKPFVVDTFNDKAWLTIVMFNATGSRFRFTPQWTTYRPIPQMNVRTYVKFGTNSEKGVYFFSLNVNSLLASAGANTIYGLPFNTLGAAFEKENETYAMQFKSSEPFLSVSYSPSGPTFAAQNNELTKFLTERYCIWQIKGRKIIKAPIIHASWMLSEVEVQLSIHDSTTENVDFIIPKPLKKACMNDNFLAYYSPFKHTKLFPYEVNGLYS